MLAALHSAFPVGPILAPYTEAAWHPVTAGTPIELDGGLRATAVPLSGKRPRYARELVVGQAAAAQELTAGQTAPAPARLPDAAAGEREDWTIAYRFTDAVSGRTLLYAPCLAEWTEAFERAVEDADVVILDGTFLADDEMARGSGGQRTSRGMGHLAICDSLPLLARRPGPRYLYTHLNNTNPLAHPGAPEHTRLADAGAHVPTDGLLLEL